MRIFFTLSVVLLLTASSAFAQTKTRPKAGAKPQPVKVEGIPEAFPVDPKAQKKWYTKWTVRNKLPVGWLYTFSKLLAGEAENYEKAMDSENERSKPRKPVLRYYKKMFEWHEKQANLIEAVFKLKLGQLPIKDSEAHKSKVDEMDEQIKDNLKEFRKLLSQRPEKPK